MLHERFEFSGFLCLVSRHPMKPWEGSIIIPRGHPWCGVNPHDLCTVAPVESGRYLNSHSYVLTFKGADMLRKATVEMQLKALAHAAKRVTARA
jgi:hypothetical protein